jgi:hypothetical protein
MATTAQSCLGGVATGTPVQRFVYPPFNPAALSYMNSVSGPIDQIILSDPKKWYNIGRKLGVGKEGYKGVVAYHQLGIRLLQNSGWAADRNDISPNSIQYYKYIHS